MMFVQDPLEGFARPVLLSDSPQEGGRRIFSEACSDRVNVFYKESCHLSRSFYL